MSKPKILIQFDSDSHASTFDSIVAIDAGVDHLVPQAAATEDHVEGLVHGSMFTRGPDDLKSTALFFGGADVAKTELLVKAAKASFFGPVRVSLMSDPNGSNTTAAAAVVCAEKHVTLSGSTVTILAGTGPVGQRIAQIVGLATAESDKTTTIRIGSRKLEKSETICQQLRSHHPHAQFEAVQTGSAEEALATLVNADIVFAAGAAGVALLPESWLEAEHTPRVAIDLNAVPPAGIPGVDVMDSGEERNSTICYGAIGVGGLKMKIHKRAIKMLFEANDHVLETDEIYRLGKSL